MKGEKRYHALEKFVQIYISKQARWGLGHNSTSHINLFARLYIPPSNAFSLDLSLSLDIEHYHALLIVSEMNHGQGVCTEIASVSVSQSEKAVMDELEYFVLDALNKYDHKEDKQFEEKLRYLLASAYILERNAYRKHFNTLPDIEDPEKWDNKGHL